MLGTILVAVVMLGLAITWWQGRDSEPGRKNQIDTVQNKTSSVNNDTVAATNTTNVTGDVGTTIKDSDTHAVQNDTAASGKTGQQNSQETVVKTKALTNDAATGSKQIDVNKSSVAVALDKAQSKIVIHAKQSSWADIRDAKNNKLLYDTVSAGRVVTIKGVGPFNIFLGNAAGIDLKFNGKKYDLEQHRNGLVARFKLSNEVNQ
jgi:cytoskeleton protein RodZ